MANKIWIYILFILFIAMAIIAGIFYFKSDKLQKRNNELLIELQNKIPFEQIDSNTWRKTGTGITEDEMKQYIKEHAEDVYKLLNIRKQTQTGFIETRIVYKYDSIKIVADTVYKDKYGIEFGKGKFEDKWYYTELEWTCNPYKANIITNRFYDKILLIPYETDLEKGVYISTENPNSTIEDVKYFFKKPEPTLFGISAGIISDKKFNESILFTAPSYKKNNIMIGYKLNDGFKKFNIDNLRFGYFYKFN